MSIQMHLSRRIPADTLEVGRAMLAEGNPFRQIGDRFDELFPMEEEYAAIYEETGRGAISPVLLSIVRCFRSWRSWRTG